MEKDFKSNTVILVTGGAGFIGSNFISLISKERPGWRIICVDSFTYASNEHNLEEVANNINFVLYKNDIRNRNDIYNIFKTEQPDVVVNFAAESSVDKSIDKPSLFFETNVLGTQVLLDACVKFGVKRFHQISTDEVYGDLPLNNQSLIFKEDFLLRPSSPYSASKASADLLTLSYFRTYGLPVTISRSCNNYGPHQYYDKLIPLIIECAFKNTPIPIYGNGLNIREWIYVEDHCKAILNIIEKGTPGETYNVGSGVEKTNVEITRTILEECNKSKLLITYVRDRKGHDLRYAVDSTKIKRELGWKPTTSFNDGIKLTIESYRCQTK